MTELDYIKLSLEHAPADPGPMNPDLIGWLTPEGNTLCAVCAARMIARGCHLPRNSEPIWRGHMPEESTKADCCGCGGKDKEKTQPDTVKHTPTPWSFKRCELGSPKNRLNPIIQGNGCVVARMFNTESTITGMTSLAPGPTEVAEANARFIVQACNSHDELVAALEAMIASFGRYTTNGDGLNAIQLAYDALKKAKGN